MVRIYKAVLFFSNVISYLAIFGGAYFIRLYIISEENPLRHEAGMGLVLFITYGLFPSILSLGIVVKLGDELSKTLRVVSTVTIPLYILLFLIYLAV